MAKKSLIVKTARQKRASEHRHGLGLDPKPGQQVKTYNRCSLCGRSHGYIRKFDICRICFRERAQRGELMGVKKSSW
ncbi:type Z 30S ribosomal protein S14 [Patescibacteria group bacterium]|nr:type Z 30S ribosomal protein S14 [Patescibacteria group bacterium]